ncbi:hypothetical protein ACGFIF_14505 [Kribbella sp. NPDC049174]|uniref:hypothetical protein n=1 Tax=Kribbella sp. NPDC049174 TaxID=3364112 RepID=UPI003724AC54
MSATVQTPLVPAAIQGPTREEPLIEALLPDDYASLVHLAYLILPPSASRPRRVAAAHGVVQRVLPPAGAYPREFIRRSVVQEAARQASRRTALCRLGGLLAPTDAADFNPCARDLDSTAIQQRVRRGRRFAVTVTALTAVGVLASLLMS